MRGLLKLLSSKASKDAAVSTLPGTALSTLGGLMIGGPQAALAYGAGDFLLNYPLLRGARKIAPGTTGTLSYLNKKGQTVTVPHHQPSALEIGANIGGTLGSTAVVDLVTGGSLIPNPTVVSQEQQIMEQMAQRAAINDLQNPQAVAPGTQFQMQGLESTFLRNYTKPQSYMSSLMPGYEDALAQLKNPLG